MERVPIEAMVCKWIRGFTGLDKTKEPFLRVLNLYSFLAVSCKSEEKKIVACSVLGATMADPGPSTSTSPSRRRETSPAGSCD